MAAQAYESPIDASPNAPGQQSVAATGTVGSGDYGQLLEEFRSGQEQLREAEDRFKQLVETIPGVAYIAEPGGTVSGSTSARACSSCSATCRWNGSPIRPIGST